MASPARPSFATVELPYQREKPRQTDIHAAGGAHDLIGQSVDIRIEHVFDYLWMARQFKFGNFGRIESRTFPRERPAAPTMSAAVNRRGRTTGKGPGG